MFLVFTFLTYQKPYLRKYSILNMYKQLMLLFFTSCFLLPKAQQPAPKVFIKTETCKSVLFSDVIKNDTNAIVVFWATWCNPCINELENLKFLISQQQNKNIKVYAVSVDDSRTSNKAKSFAKSKRWPFTILLDPNNDLMRAFNISNPPYSCVIKKGVISFAKNGYIQGSETELLKAYNKN